MTRGVFDKLRVSVVTGSCAAPLGCQEGQPNYQDRAVSSLDRINHIYIKRDDELAGKVLRLIQQCSILSPSWLGVIRSGARVVIDAFISSDSIMRMSTIGLYGEALCASYHPALAVSPTS